MANVTEYWLISFANANWNLMGSLCLYVAAQEQIRNSLRSLDPTEIEQELKKCLGDMGSVRQRLKRFKRKCPHSCHHSRLFLRILETIIKMPIENMSDDLKKACLIILLILHQNVVEIIKNDEYTSCALFLLEGIKKNASNDKNPLQVTDNLLYGIGWNIRDWPWKARMDDGEHVNFSERLFDHDIFLIVFDRNGIRNERIPVLGRTIFNVLQTIYDFYRMAENKFFETHTEKEYYLDHKKENVNEKGWSMGDKIWFQGIYYKSRLSSWVVSIGS